MKGQSAKAKGRRFQQFVRDTLLKNAPSLEPDDIRSTSMGASGEDILFSPAARKIYPISVECKNVEKLNIWEALKQTIANAGKYRPVLFFTRNHSRTWVAIDIEYYMELLNAKNNKEK